MLGTALRYACALAALPLALSCGDTGSGPDFDGTSRVSVVLTDDPDDLAHAWVVIREIYLQGGAAEGRLVLFQGPSEPVDLLTLADSFDELVQVEIPSGRYGQLRLVLDGAAIETEDGRVFAMAGTDVPGEDDVDGELRCPSCTTSGIKVLLQGRDLTIDDPLETLILDFDVSESFARQAGITGRWTLHPVIKLFDDPAETDQT